MPIRILISVAAQLLIASAAFAATADGVPTYDVTPSCRAAAADNVAQDRYDTCMQSEQLARNQAAQQWSEFTRPERTLCSATATAGGEPTYTELITCLEMTRDARHPSKQQNAATPAPTTSGMATDGVPAGATPGMLHRQPRRSD